MYLFICIFVIAGLSCDLEFNIPKLNCNPFNSKSNLSCHVLAPKSDNTTVSLMLVRLRNGTLESLQHSEINQVLTHEELIKTSLWLAPALLDKKSHESIHIWCQALINNIPLIMMSFVDFNINLPPCQEKEYTLYYTRACINKRTAGLRNQSFKPHITERQADNTDDKCDNSKSCSGGEIGGIVVTVLFLVGSLIVCLVLIAYLAFKLYHKIGNTIQTLIKISHNYVFILSDEEEPTTVAQ